MGKIEIIQGDITSLEADAIVNAANSSLLGGGGVDGAIHRKGGKTILDECIKIRETRGECPTGEAVITTAGNLPAKFVIHTVGPVWQGGNSNEHHLLAKAYENSLKLANQYHLEKVAFPNISTGIYRYPKKDAAVIALKTTQKFLSEYDLPQKVVFVCFDAENYTIYKDLMKELL